MQGILPEVQAEECVNETWTQTNIVLLREQTAQEQFNAWRTRQHLTFKGDFFSPIFILFTLILRSL